MGGDDQAAAGGGASGRLGVVVGLTLLVLAGLPAAAEAQGDRQALASPGRHLRWTDLRVSRLVESGRARSDTFRRLVDAVDRSSVIVYVEVEDGVREDLAGALSFMASSGETRFVRVRLYPQAPPWTAMLINEPAFVGTLAHELQHAMEVASHASVRDEAGFIALFATVGFAVPGRRGRHAFETDAARVVGQRVEDEMRRGRSAPPGPPPAAAPDTTY